MSDIARWLEGIGLGAHAGAFAAALEGGDPAAVGTVTDAPRLVVRGLRGDVLVDVDVASLRTAHAGGFHG